MFILLTDEICVCLCKQLHVFAAGKGPVGMRGAAAILVYYVCVCARLPHTPARGTWLLLPSHAASRLSDYFRAENATLGLG